ncbi:MAG: cold shock domain-containing protein, partial [Cyclobacteriaceae bacterium]
MKGKISQWNDNKGFGFIQPEDGSEKLFFHVSSVKTSARRPKVGDSVLYESIRDSQQRLKAKGVVIEGVAKDLRSTSNKRAVRTEGPK